MRPSLRQIFSAFACSLLLLTPACQPAPTATATASPLSADLSELSGAVGLKQSGDADFSEAQNGMSLHVNGQVRTGDDGRARLDLTSGTIVRVVPATVFTLESNEPVSNGLATRIKMEIGRIFIILNGGSIDVETPSGVASVLGSFMMVHVAGNQDVLITCLEGHCSASNSAGTVQFTAGQKAILVHYDLPGDARLPQVEDMTDEDFEAWLKENPEAEAIYRALIAELTTSAPTETPEITETPEPSPEPMACVELLGPSTGSELGISGPAEFSWSEYPGAAKYILTIHFPSGISVMIDTTKTSSTRYLDVLDEGGEFTWDVTVLDAQGNMVCQSASSSFIKAPPSGGAGNSNEEEEPPTGNSNQIG